MNSWSETAAEAAEEKRRLRSAGESLRAIGKRKAWNSWAEIAKSMASAMKRDEGVYGLSSIHRQTQGVEFMG